jgi:hypothetical protein
MKWNKIKFPIRGTTIYNIHRYILADIHTYLLTPWSRVLLEKLTGFELVKKLPAFYGTKILIPAFTSAGHLSLC